MNSMVTRGVGIVTLLVAAVLVGRNRSTPAQAADVVDSVVPREVAITRFRSGLARVDSLSGGAESRDALVHNFLRALEARDSTALRTMILTRAEFAWLYYPNNPQGLAPYDLSPNLMWFMLEGRSTRGIAQALAERGGQPLRVARYDCDDQPSIEGANRIWGPCLVYRLRAPHDTLAERLFGPVIERGGRFKFVSFANRL